MRPVSRATRPLAIITLVSAINPLFFRVNVHLELAVEQELFVVSSSVPCRVVWLRRMVSWNEAVLTQSW